MSGHPHLPPAQLDQLAQLLQRLQPPSNWLSDLPCFSIYGSGGQEAPPAHLRMLYLEL